MDVWQSLDRLVRSWAHAYRDGDPDLDDAWEELERYLGSSVPETAYPRYREAHLPLEIRQAYHDLEVAEGSGLEEVRRAYRRLLLRYHPDRHEDDPERRKTAIEITQRLSVAYKRINRYYSRRTTEA